MERVPLPITPGCLRICTGSLRPLPWGSLPQAHSPDSSTLQSPCSETTFYLLSLCSPAEGHSPALPGASASWPHPASSLHLLC